MLRRAHRLLLVMIAVAMSIAVAGPFRGIAGVRASIATTFEIAQWRRSAPPSENAQRHVDVGLAAGDDLSAIEAETEEDDALRDVADGTTACALACAPERRVVRPHRVETTSDTSRDTRRPTFARGPPV